MIHKRQGNKLIMPKEWQERMDKEECPVCGQANKRQYRCCSPACTVEFWKTAFWSMQVREKIFARDNQTCQDCKRSNAPYLAWSKRAQEWSPYKAGIDERERIFTDNEVLYAKYHPDDPMPREPALKLEVDHIVPIALGGAEYDLNNMQTLCEECHKKKTAKEAILFAHARNNQKTLIECVDNQA